MQAEGPPSAPGKWRGLLPGRTRACSSRGSLPAASMMRTVGAVIGQLRAFAGRPGEGEQLIFGGTTIIVRASAAMTGGAFSMFEESAPLLDTSRHVHASEDEMYYVVEGEHVYQCGDEEFRAGPGDLVLFAPGRTACPSPGRAAGRLADLHDVSGRVRGFLPDPGRGEPGRRPG